MLEKIRNQLIVSCQPVIGGALDRPEIVAAFAMAALEGGAAALRIEGIANLKAVRERTSAPVIGLVKRDLDTSDVRITPFAKDVIALIENGADIVAIDATLRPRPEEFQTLAQLAKDKGALVMADCSTLEDARSAKVAGADILGTTMAGYTGDPEPETPDLQLVQDIKALGTFVIAEGRYHHPDQAAQARAMGADAVVIGSAITRPELITGWFLKAVKGAPQ